MKKYSLRLLTLTLLAVLTLCLLPNSTSAAQQKLGTPTDLTWHLQMCWDNNYNTWTVEHYGSVAWKPTSPISPAEPVQFEVKIYKDNELWQTILQGFGPQVVSEDSYLSSDAFSFREFESGTYYFTIQAIDETGTYAPSGVVKSATWKYEKPSDKLPAPTNLRWDTKDTIKGWWPWAKWDPVSDAPSYEVWMTYSPTKDGERFWFHHQWKITETRNAPPFFAIEDGLSGPGYYFFSVRTCSDDITKVSNSHWVESEPYHWKMSTPKVKISNVSSSGKLKLTWDKVEFAEKYQIYRATSRTGSYSLLKTTTSASFTDTTAAAGKVYYYKVRAITGNGYKSSYSTPVSLRCDLAQPVVTAGNVSSSGLPKLTWKAVTGAEKYLIYRRSTKESTYTRIGSTTSVTYTDKTAEAGTKYYYKVTAVHSNTAANSAMSETVSTTCDLARPVVTIKLSSGDPRLTWKKIPGAAKYYVYRATSKTGTYKHVKTTKSVSSFTDTTAKAGKTYYYKVKAVHTNTAANSAYSAIDSIKAR